MNGPAEQKFRAPSLVDFGTGIPGHGPATGRRLEWLGGLLVDRPLAQPDLPPCRHPGRWCEAAAVFRDDAAGSSRGRWHYHRPLPDPWQVRLPLGDAAGAAALVLEVRPAPSGQLGVFLEQLSQWQWLASVTRPRLRALSLFAHSGAATIALAAAGAEVTQVDASRQATALARRNAAASGLDQKPIRWLCEDARTFVAREVRRGAAYDAVVLDPPSWGHGPKGQAFSIDRDLQPLLDDLAKLLGDRPRGPILLTCHSPRWHHRQLRDTLIQSFGLDGCESGRLTCTDASGRALTLGDYARHLRP